MLRVEVVRWAFGLGAGRGSIADVGCGSMLRAAPFFRGLLVGFRVSGLGCRV